MNPYPSTPDLNAFLGARDFLLQHRDNYEFVYGNFHWPSLTRFNWALDYFEGHARGNQKTALWIVDENGAESKLSYDQMSRRSNQVANFLRKLGVRRGDRIIVMLPNVAAMWEVMLASMKLGTVVIPATTLLTPDDLKDRLTRGQARHVITLAAFTERFSELPGDYSRIISPKATKRLAGLIDQNKVVIGGASDPEARYLDPTVIYPVTWDDPIMEDEIFGPILPILTYKDMDAAIREVKKHPKPLSGFLFSRDQQAIDHFLASLSFGGGAINQVNIHLFIETMPFGGVGYSGIGHYYGKAGFDALTHAKSVLISPPDVAIEHLFPPYTEEKVKALSQWFEY